MRGRRATALLIASLLLGAALWLTGLFECPADRGRPLEGGWTRRPPTEDADLLPQAPATQPELRGAPPREVRGGPAATTPARTPVTVAVRGVGGTAVAQARLRIVADDDGSPGALLDKGVFALPATFGGFAQTVWIQVLEAMDEAGTALPLKSGWSGPHEPDVGAIGVVLPANWAIAGKVIDARGAPLSGTRVVALYPILDEHYEKAAEVTSDEHGAFRLERLRHATYHLTAFPRDPHAEPDSVPVEAPATGVDVRVRPGLVAALEVVTLDGEALVGARVEVTAHIPKRGEPRVLRSVVRTQTDASGRVTLDGLDPERRYVLRVRAPESRPELSHVIDTGWRPADQRVVLLSGRELRGRVVGPDGQPRAGVRVYVSAEDGSMPARNAKSGRDGRFVVHGVALGPLVAQTSQVRTGRAWLTSGTWTVGADEDDVRLVMQAWVEACLIVRLRNWPPQARGAVARLTGRPGASRGSSVGSAVNDVGEARFRLLPPADGYTLYVATPDLSLCAYERDVARSDRTHEMDLVPALQVRGRVELPPSATNARIRVTGPGFRQDAAIEADGTFVVGGLPAGTWTLRATARLGAARLARTLEVAAGEKIDLVLTKADERGR